VAKLPFFSTLGNDGAIRNARSHQSRQNKEHARTDILITRVALADILGEDCHTFLDNAQAALDKGRVEPAYISRLINFLKEGAYPHFLDWSLVALAEAKSRTQRESILELARSNALVNSPLVGSGY
jgi:hypothetical protein